MILIALVLVFVNDFPSIQIVLFSLMQLVTIIITVQYQPFVDKSLNTFSIIGELVITGYLIHIRCFTDWVPDPEARNIVGYSMMLMISL